MTSEWVEYHTEIRPSRRVRRPALQVVQAEIGKLTGELGEVTNMDRGTGHLSNEAYRQRELGRLEAILWLVGQGPFYRPGLPEVTGVVRREPARNVVPARAEEACRFIAAGEGAWKEVRALIGSQGDL